MRFFTRLLAISAITLLPLAGLSAQEGTPEAAADPLPIGRWDECAAPQNLPDVIEIGAPLGLTGPISIYGVPQQQGVDLAVLEINNSGYLGASRLAVNYEDTEGDPEQTIAAMTKLIEQDNVTVVFGPSLSTEAFAADPIAQEAGVPVMGVTTSADGIPELGDYVFRGNLPEKVLIPHLIETIQPAYNLERVAVLYGDDDDFTLDGYDMFVQALADNDIAITGEATFARGDIDFSPQLTTLIADDPDALVVSALGREGVQILLQARELGYEGPVLGGNGFNTPDIIEQAGDAAEGLLVGASWNILGGNDLSQRFVTAFEQIYNYSPNQFSVQAYNAIWLYATAIRCANSANRDAVRDALISIDNFESPLGAFSFTDVGDADHAPVVQVVQNGQFVPFAEANLG